MRRAALKCATQNSHWLPDVPRRLIHETTAKSTQVVSFVRWHFHPRCRAPARGAEVDLEPDQRHQPNARFRNCFRRLRGPGVGPRSNHSNQSSGRSTGSPRGRPSQDPRQLCDLLQPLPTMAEWRCEGQESAFFRSRFKVLQRRPSIWRRCVGRRLPTRRQLQQTTPEAAQPRPEMSLVAWGAREVG